MRVRALLTQAELADRMKLHHVEIWRLERAKLKKPTLEMIARFLRVCGASWSELFDLLEPVEVPENDMKAIVESEFSNEVKERMKRKLERQVYKFSRKLPYSFGGKPEPPERHRRTAEKLRNYRVVVNIVEQAITELLKEKPLSTVHYPIYKAVARQMLGILWRNAGKGMGHRALDIGEERIARTLEEKSLFWQEQKLDMGIVGEVQATVTERFERLRKEYPELLPEPDEPFGTQGCDP
jgi:transcriptional regulator with XRE-family HTH domain